MKLQMHILNAPAGQITPWHLQRSATLERRHHMQWRSAVQTVSLVQLASNKTFTALPSWTASPRSSRHVARVSAAPAEAAASELHQGLWATDGEARYKALVERFHAADLDNNGVIDRDELRALLEGFEDGRTASEKHWLTDEEVEKVLNQYDTGGNGSINLEEFQLLAKDGVLLHGTIQQYLQAFGRVDSDNDGLVTAEQLGQLFGGIDSGAMNASKIAAEFERYDVDQTGSIGFYEFLRMFRAHLLDLESVVQYLHQPPPEAAGPPAVEESVDGLPPGEVKEISSEEELDAIIAADDRPVCLLAGFTWCRPCKSLQMPFQKLAEKYQGVKMLKFYGNANENTKSLFRDRLKARATPTIAMFNATGEIEHMHTGANKSKLEFYLREFIGLPEDSGTLYPAYKLTEKELEERAKAAKGE